MVKKNFGLDKDNSAKIEPKLTIVRKNNPQVFDWVNDLSRGKLTQFIYEVLNIYMENGFLLKNSWVHPTDNIAMQLLNNDKEKKVDLSGVEVQLLDIQNKLNFIVNNMNQMNQMNQGANSLPMLLSALMQGGLNNQQTFYQQPMNPNGTTQDHTQHLTESQELAKSNNTQTVQDTQHTLEVVHSPEISQVVQNTDTSDLIFSLDDEQPPSPQTDANPKSQETAFTTSGGFAIY